MVKLKYVGVMASGLAVCVNFKINVNRDEVYDIPLSASKYFLKTKNWVKANAQKEVKKEEVKEEESKEEELYINDEYKEEVE